MGQTDAAALYPQKVDAATLSAHNPKAQVVENRLERFELLERLERVS